MHTCSAEGCQVEGNQIRTFTSGHARSQQGISACSCGTRTLPSAICLQERQLVVTDALTLLLFILNQFFSLIPSKLLSRTSSTAVLSTQNRIKRGLTSSSEDISYSATLLSALGDVDEGELPPGLQDVLSGERPVLSRDRLRNFSDSASSMASLVLGMGRVQRS